MELLKIPKLVIIGLLAKIGPIIMRLKLTFQTCQPIAKLTPPVILQ